MRRLAPRSVLARGGSLLLGGSSALIAAVWVAICAGAPEFIWQGMLIAWGHVSGTEALSALLVGLVLAFFVEPLMERLRNLPGKGHDPGNGQDAQRLTQWRGNEFFTAALALVFALVSIILHDALTAFVAERNADAAAARGGIAEAISLTLAWATVPFALMLAWLSLPRRWLAVPFGFVGALSPVIAGWLFGWTAQDVVTTTIPGLAILALGYRQMAKPGRAGAFARCARTVAGVALAWLAFAAIVDVVLSLFRLDQYRLYEPADFWTDVRFYLGWSLGLLFAPLPRHFRGADGSD